MYLEIDEGYFEHPKTLRLCAALKDHHAAIFPLRLWKWACRSARDGELGIVDAFIVEKVVGYEAMDGRCFLALCAGFLDVGPDGEVSIHDWMIYTGGAIERMEAESRRKKIYRDSRRPIAAASKDVHGMSAGQSTDEARTKPTQTRPDQSSPDPESTQTPACARKSNTPANEPGKPTPRNVVALFLRIRSEILNVPPFANPLESDVEKASEWLSSSVELAQVDKIEPAMRLAVEHVRDGVDGWNGQSMTKIGMLWGSFIRSWYDLLEELAGCSPKAKAKTNVGRVQEQPKTWKVVER
jgi:hypothetical protein